jgi:hypothetical protein
MKYLFIFLISITLIVLISIDPICIGKRLFTKKSKYDIQDEMTFFNEAKWVEKVINSCEYKCQIWVCDKLIQALDNKYHNKVDSDLRRKVIYNLNTNWLKQENKLLHYAPKNK